MKTQLSLTALAGGAQAGTAIDLEADFIVISTCATAGDSVQLPSTGSTDYHKKEHIIRNEGSTACAIFPQTDQALKLQHGTMANNLAYSLQPNCQISFAVIGNYWTSIREPLPIAERKTAEEFTVYAYENGKTFTLPANNSGGHLDITLPSPATVGLKFRFVMIANNAGHNWIITSTGANMILKLTELATITSDAGGVLTVSTTFARNAGNTYTTATLTTGSLIGDCVEIVSDGSRWVGTGLTGAVGGITVA